MANNLSVKITADIAELQARAAVARAELSATTGEMNKLAKAAAASGAGQITPELLQAAQAAAAARGHFNELNEGLVKAGVNVHGIREISAAVRELASGDVSHLPATMALLGHSVGELGIAGIAGVAAVAALGAAAYELTKHLEEAREAAEAARGAFAWEGLAETRAQINAFVVQIAAIPGVTQKAAGETVAAMAQIKEAPPQVLQALTALMPDLIAKFGSGKAAVEAFAKEWNDALTKGDDPAAVFDRWVTASGRFDRALDNSARTAKTFGERIMEGFAALAGGADQVEAAIASIDDAKLKKIVADTQAAKEALADNPPAADTSSAKAFDAWRKELENTEVAEHVSFDRREAFERSFWQSKRQIVAAGSDAEKGVLKSLYDEDIGDQRAAADEAKRLAREREQEARRAAQVQQEIQKDIANTTIQLSRIRIQEERDTLDAQYQLGLISAEQKGETLRALAEDEYRIDLQRLDDELATLDAGTVAWQQTADRIRILMAQHAADLAKINQQIVIDSRRTAEQDVSAWKGAVGEITSAESSLVSNIFSGRQRLSQSLLQAAGQLVEREIADDARAVTTRLLLRSTAAVKEKALEQGGFAYKAVANWLDVGSTESAEAAKTAAVAAGSQARAAAESAAAVESKAVSAAIGSSTVMADAAKAAAGAYSALAGIPIVGPVIAPIAAGVAFAAVAAYEGLASSAGGDWNVDATRLNIVHPRETIMPASVAGPMRDFFTNGSAAGSDGGVQVNFSPVVHAQDGASVAAFFNKHGRTLARTVAREFQRNPSLRGAY